MTKYHLIAKIVLLIVGVQVLVLLMNSLSLVFVVHRELSNPYRTILTFSLFIICTLLIVYYVIFKNDGLASWIEGFILEGEPIVSGLWVIACFRAAMFFCGAMIIAHNIDFICNILSFIIEIPGMIICKEIFDKEFFYWLFHPVRRNPVDYFKLILGIYLILGAPHIVKAQIKRYGYYKSMKKI
jgi:hypothetical protein